LTSEIDFPANLMPTRGKEMQRVKSTMVRTALQSAAFLSCFVTIDAAADPTSTATNIFAPQSTPARSILHLSTFVLTITGIIFVVVFTLLVYAIAKFRARSATANSEPAQVYGSTQIELAWTIIPVLIVVVLFMATARVIHAMQDAPEPTNAVKVTVIGHQFWWEYRYPELGVVTANELHIPVSDVAHPTPTFLAIAFGRYGPQLLDTRVGWQDGPCSESPKPDVDGSRAHGVFVGQCAQYCGTQHAKMLLRVSVDTPEDFCAVDS
jgi:cytochrome c oxidase subunit 2